MYLIDNWKSLRLNFPLLHCITEELLNPWIDYNIPKEPILNIFQLKQIGKKEKLYENMNQVQ